MKQPPHLVDLSQCLNNQQLSQAWEFLHLSATSDLQPSLPPALSHLTELEWFLAGQLLNQTLEARARSPLH